ncbi:CLUMA_CG019675, isoform A [Clunio marinus]|uniref:CLUMA_CG019675, isoform A n=1 Tax=Clunio marinus TaxID=568069 RepID=A0A1J1J4L8_9DIPT|nr:CLUMA_CG019675, isoform A [Clunio marinus]
MVYTFMTTDIYRIKIENYANSLNIPLQVILETFIIQKSLQNCSMENLNRSEDTILGQITAHIRKFHIRHSSIKSVYINNQMSKVSNRQLFCINTAAYANLLSFPMKKTHPVNYENGHHQLIKSAVLDQVKLKGVKSFKTMGL